MFNQFPFPLSLVFGLHILAGVLALAFFTLPLFSKKGGKVHVRTGWTYAVAMLVVSLSTFLIAPWRYSFDPRATDASRASAFFLFFIAVFSLTALQQGLFVFNYKKRVGKISSWASLGLPIVLINFSALTMAYGLATKNWLFVAFAAIAGRTAFKQVKYWNSSPVHKQHWWFFHLENMFTCCIATVTAFMVTAVPRLYPGMNSIWVWLAPTFIMVPWMTWFSRRYERKFAGR